jgi:CPA1 family monovalent cation:H+ antiporter
MHAGELMVLSGIVVAGFGCQWLAWRVRLPSILLLLLAGTLAGPVFHWIDPDRLLGDLLRPVVSLAVAVILYEGALTLRLSEIRGQGGVVRNLVTVGVLITWVSASFAAWYFLDWHVYLATLFGAIVTVSGPTVIVPLLKTIRPKSALARILRWEGILVDPLGAILAVLVFDFMVITQTADTTSQLFGIVGLIVAVGSATGIVAGHALGVVLRNHWLPDYLRDYAALATLVLAFAASEALAAESGLLAATVMGIWQANMRDLEIEDILDFKESLTLVLVAAVFILLAARLDFGHLARLGAGALVVLVFLQLLAGPARALVCTIGSGLAWRDRLYLGWILPRGIVAAAVASLFALRLEELKYPGADDLVPLVFTIIIGTVVLQSLSGRLVARWFGVSEPEPHGVLIIGANPAALAFAHALHDEGRRVIVSSMNWYGIRKARMAGLPVYYGSPVSSYADSHLDLSGIGFLLAMSDRPDLNELSCLRFRYEFGRDAVYTIRQASESGHEKHKISGQSGGRLLYDGERSIVDLIDAVNAGAEPRTTEISENYTYEDYKSANPERIPLFVSHEDGRLVFPVDSDDPEVRPSWRVSALLPAEKKKSRVPD